jgi:hypothetical protein
MVDVPSGGDEASNGFVITYTGTLAPTSLMMIGCTQYTVGLAGVSGVPTSGLSSPNKTGGWLFLPGVTNLLTTLEFTNLGVAVAMPIATTLSISPNPSLLTSLSFPVLTSVIGSLSLGNAALLTAYNFQSLVFVSGQLSLGSTPLLTTLSLPALQAVGTAFALTLMDALTTLSVPSLVAVGTTCSPSSMALLTTLSFPALQTVGTAFSPSTMASLTTLSVPSLVVVGTNLGPNTMASLTTLSFPALQTVGSNLNPSTMASLTTLSLPALVSTGAITVNTGFGNLANVTIGATLKSCSGNVTFSGQKLTAASVNNILAVFAALDGTNGTTAWGAGKTLTLNGGTNAAPTGQGITDKATIQARGATVLTN